MGASDYLTLLNILIAFLGVLLVAGLGLEWLQLRTLRQELKTAKRQLQQEFYASMKAAHRVLASYNLSEPDEKISLLKSALAEYPGAFNAWNSLGYAWLAKGDTASAIDAFQKAIAAHPEDRAGYCDLAAAYMSLDNLDLALEYCEKAIRADASARADLLADARFARLHDKLEKS